MEQSIDLLRPHLKSIRAPEPFSAVYKNECQFSFDTPFSEKGLFVNLSSHQAFGSDFVALDHQRSGGRLYLHMKWEKHEKPAEETTDVTKMAIGVDGGFQTDDQKYEIVKHHSIALIPEMALFPYPNPELPELISVVVEAILSHTDASDVQEVMAWEEEIKESKYARTLVQEANGKKISSDPSTWICEESGLRENLWLNLSDGYIGSGRRNWDGTGGTGAALAHYQAMKAEGKNYPLVVKLGTITAQGADVYSYAEDENDAVTDPLLAQHLTHFGINAMQLTKTEKTMAELQVELNKNWEFDRVTEAGKTLVSVCGPGHVGLQNLGSTCYLNTVVQCLFAIPFLQERYVLNGISDALFRSAPQKPAEDILTQMAKLGVGLTTDRYTKNVDPAHAEQAAIKPSMIRSIISKGHNEFSTGRQQDAHEYFEHFIETLKRLEHGATSRLSAVHSSTGHDTQIGVDDLFRIQLRERVECGESHKCRYTHTTAVTLGLPISLEDATNKTEVDADRAAKRQKVDNGSAATPPPKDDDVKPTVPFERCISRFASLELVNDFFSSATNRRGQALKRTRIEKFPKFLVVQLRKFYIDSDWTPKKMSVLVDVPEEFDFAALREQGPADGEQLLPDDPAPAAAQPPQPTADPGLVAQLVSMGFSENGCKKAAVATNNNPDAAMEWVLSHMGDADFDLPPVTAGDSATPEPSSEDISTLSAMGFSEQQAKKALRATANNMERAVDWLFSHGDAMDDTNDTAAPAAAALPPTPQTGSSKYVLRSFITHIGANTHSGHYVCHIRDRETGKWHLFNDGKVAECDNPPKDLGYVYFFEQA